MVAGGAHATANAADVPQGFPFGDAATARAYLDDYAVRHRARLARDPRRGLAAQRLLVWDIKRVGLADRLLSELEGLRWPAKNQRQGLSSERYLVLPSNIKSDAYGSLRALCAELMAWADPAYR